MVAQQIFHAHRLGGGVFAHGNASRSCEIILGDRGTCQFKVSANEHGRHAVDGGLYALAIAVVGECGEVVFSSSILLGEFLRRATRDQQRFLVLISCLLSSWMNCWSIAYLLIFPVTGSIHILRSVPSYPAYRISHPL